uniref:Uncharacterized protein n=1 Tax=Utricularia reniformis TaxID=192314 RepID=A0A1Y0B1Y1_9LAMI|nr:hypothetical protein AEK19_MT1185 [Utricularia reniformis]ART31398.1 hypothetical protein AEK19_MT1185 [Utricularia reniformis]
MKEIDLSALDDLERGLLLSPVGARSVAQELIHAEERKAVVRAYCAVLGGVRA